MFKFFGGVLVGTFMGAVALEILRRYRPELIEDVERQAKLATDRLFESLKDDLGDLSELGDLTEFEELGLAGPRERGPSA